LELLMQAQPAIGEPIEGTIEGSTSRKESLPQ
jgi:hypothetical protein